MSKPMPLRQGAGCALATVIYPILGILGLVLHLYTILLALGTGSIAGAFFSLIAPAVSEMYWCIWAWYNMGTFWNPYSPWVVAYGVLWLLLMVSQMMMEHSGGMHDL